MLKACRRTATEFISFYNRRESIFASFIAENIFTSFCTFGSKRAKRESLDPVYTILCKTLTMDPNSIITQVPRDQDQLNTYQASLPDNSRGNSCCSICVVLTRSVPGLRYNLLFKF